MRKLPERRGRPPGTGKLYHWERWFAKDRVKLQRGVHYRCPQGSFCTQMRNAAGKLGYSLSVEEGDDYFVVHVRSRPADKAPPPKRVKVAADVGGWYAPAR